MIISLAYGLAGSTFLVMLTNLLIKVFKKFNNIGYSIVYASLFLKTNIFKWFCISN
jgi:heme O synthase-like polyprenyltransferase